ncbi:MAG TPA: hypothetical protein DD643_07290, partial [Synechococcus sp. UBA8638]|nr:hypothetical protein [Synechococcus sp. UBA8638]
MDHGPDRQWPVADAAHLLAYPRQMQTVEQAMFSAGMPQAALMEKAALAVSRRVLELLGAAEGGRDHSRPVVVLIGPGHNGGDGAVLLRELHMAGRGVGGLGPVSPPQPPPSPPP